MSSSADSYVKPERVVDSFGHTTVHRGELLRHPAYTRVLHWSVAIFFILSLLSGFAVYAPWLFHWLTPIFGGGPMTRFLHPWFGLLFDIFFFFQFLSKSNVLFAIEFRQCGCHVAFLDPTLLLLIFCLDC